MRFRAAAPVLALAAWPWVQAGPGTLADLPLVEAPVVAAKGNTLAVLLSGDGDWSAATRDLTAELNQRGVPVVGLKMRSYLRSAERTPPSVPGDLERIIRHYLAAWRADSLLLIGYSRGANILPFMIVGLPPDLRARIRLIGLLGPKPHVSFAFHLVDIVADRHRSTDLPLLPVVERLRGMPMLCVYGDDEGDSLCRGADLTLMRSVSRPGGHRITEGYENLADLLASPGR